MGGSFIEGLLMSRLFTPDEIYVSDSDEIKINNIKKKYAINAVKTNRIAEICDIICLVVKPKDVKTICLDIKDTINKTNLIVSFAAGLNTEQIEKFLEKDVPVLKIMPNLSVSVCKGIIGYSRGRYFSESMLEKIKPIFTNLGFFFPIPEEKMHLLTGVSGSGPGYVFYFGEIIYKILLNNGFSSRDSKKIVGFLFEGAGKMMNESKSEPKVLKKRVSSPGGTTVAGLEVFEKHNIEEIFNKVIEAAQKRAKELSQQNT